MNNNNDSSDSEQSYQLSRRNLLRAGGAAAGVGVAGGITATAEIESPVGDAEAVAVSATTIALSAGAIGLGVGIGGTLGFLELFGQDASDVQTSVTASSIYDEIESSMIAQSAAIADLGDELGVDNSSRPDSVGGNLVAPDDNPHVHTMVEEAYAAAAEAWADGGALSEAQSAATTAARVVSVTSEWTILANWNAAINAASEALIQHYSQFGTSNQILNLPDPDGDLPDTEYQFTSSNTGIHTPVGTTDADGTSGVILVRDIGSALPTDPSNIPDDEQPDNGFKVSEVPVVDAKDRAVTPYPAGSDRLVDIPDSNYYYLHPDFVEASYDGQTTQLDVWRYRELLSAVTQIRKNVESNLDSNVETVYNQLSSGEINLSDVLSARQLYQSYEAPGDLSRSAAELIAAGIYDVPSSQVTVSFGGSTYSGTLFIEIPADISVSEGDTIPAGDHNGGYILSESDGQVRIPGDVDLTIDSITDGNSMTWERRESYAPDGSDLTDIEQRLKNNQQRYEDLQKQIEDLEGDDPLGIGFGTGDNGLLVLGGIGVGAYLLGR